VESLTDRFELGKVLTQSAGWTYVHAVERAYSRPVLLKVGSADAGLNEALAREAALLARLEHFHVSKLLDLIRLPGDGLAIKLAAVQSTLANVTRHSVASSRIELWESQLEQAVGYLHRSGVSLKGLRPEQVGIRPSGDVILFDLEGARDERFVLRKQIEQQAGAVIQLGRTPARLRESERRALAQLRSILSKLRRTRARLVKVPNDEVLTDAVQGAVRHLFAFPLVISEPKVALPLVVSESDDQGGTTFAEPLPERPSNVVSDHAADVGCSTPKESPLLQGLAGELRSGGLYLPLGVDTMTEEQIEALQEIERGLAEDRHGIYRLEAWLKAGRLCRDRFDDPKNAALFFELALDCDLNQLDLFLEIQQLLEGARLWELLVVSGERHLERLWDPPRFGNWPLVVTEPHRADLCAGITTKLANACREHLGDKARAQRLMRKGSARYPENARLVSFAVCWNLEEGTLETTQQWLTRRLRDYAADMGGAHSTDVRELLRRFGLRCAAEEHGGRAVRALRGQVLEHAEKARLAHDYWGTLEHLECALCLGGDPLEVARIHTRCAFLAENHMEQPLLAQLHRARALELLKT